MCVRDSYLLTLDGLSGLALKTLLLLLEGTGSLTFLGQLLLLWTNNNDNKYNNDAANERNESMHV